MLVAYNMSGGGTAPAMKMSDVFILVSISIIVGAFIMHSWVEPITLSNNNSHAINTSLSEGDKVDMQFSASNATTVTISLDGEVIDEIVLAEGEKGKSSFEVENSGKHSFVISVSGADDSATTTATISIDRQMMLDKLVYPVGILLLMFGLYKRKEEMEMEHSEDDKIVDAEIES